MKKIVLALALTLSLGACQQLRNIQTAVELGTASIANPVTTDRLYTMEQATKLLFAGLNTWKKLCVRGQIDPACEQQIRTVQVYTLQIPPYLKDLRRFVKTNDQINATVVWNELAQIVTEVRARAAASGQKV